MAAPVIQAGIQPGAATLSVGSESSNAIAVTITLKDKDGVALSAATAVDVWLSDSAGAAPSSTAPNGTTSFTTGTLLKEVTTKVLWRALCNSSGVLVLSIGDTGTPTFYVNVCHRGLVSSSAAVTFA